MSYEPGPGSVAARAIDFLRARGPQSSSELAEGIGIHPKQLSGSMVPALTHGNVAREKAADGFRWKIPAPDTSAEVATFMRRMVSPPEDQADDGDKTEPGQCRTCLPEIADAIGAELVAAPPKPPGLDWKAPAAPVFLQAGPFTNADVDEVSESNTPPKGAKAATASVQREVGADATPKDGAAPQGTDCSENYSLPAQASASVCELAQVGKVAATPCATAAPVRVRSAIEARKIAELLEEAKPPGSARFALWSDGHLQFDCGAGLRFLLCPEDTRALVHYLERIAVGEGA